MKNPFKLVASGMAAALAIAALSVPLAANADSTAPTPPTTSSHAVWLTKGTSNAALLPAGGSWSILQSVFAAKSADPTDRLWEPDRPANASYETEFLSDRGKEFKISDWSIYSDVHTTAGNRINLAPGNFGTANPGKSFDDIGHNGGDYSLGFAWVDANGAVIEANFVHITVTGNADATQATYTYSTPAAAATAPAVTTQPADKTVLPGQSAVFTAAASGSPAPTVTWQSSTDGTTWSDVSGATSDTLTVSNVQLSQSGTKYQAVYSNSAGSVTTTAATLTVTNVIPTEPTGSDAGKVTITDPTEGATTVTVPAGTAVKGQTLHAWGWSTATDLGPVTADAASGDVVVNISSLAPGAHTVALTQPGSSTVVAWGTFTVPAPSYPAKTDAVDLQAAVTASDLWSLNAAQTAIDFGNVARNTSATKSLGKVTVVDDRKVLKGWTLDAAWSAFTAGSDEIPASALKITPKAFDNASLLSGITLGTSGTKIAESGAVSTLTDGALFDADLIFTAPKDAKAGQYHSTLTLTLTSK